MGWPQFVMKSDQPIFNEVVYSQSLFDCCLALSQLLSPHSRDVMYVLGALNTRTCTHTHVCVYIRVYIHIRTCMQIPTCLYVYIALKLRIECTSVWMKGELEMEGLYFSLLSLTWHVLFQWSKPQLECRRCNCQM